MGKEVVYCSVCGERILERDFEKGKAVTILKKNYCRKCSKTVVQESIEKGASAHLPTDPPPRQQRTARMPLADKREVPAKKTLIPTPFLIAILIGSLAIILLIYVLSRGSRPG